ncbi:MAG: chromosome segregation protein ParM, partial [Calothrix sp. MO_167.B12]|nr:chromosome segregation protein ParM [Calothrix sp. MO_167.B12]
MTDQPSAATPMNAAAIPMNRVPAANPINAAPKPLAGGGKNILSVDLGRTSTKTCVSRDAGNVTFVPSNVKQMSMEQVRGG